MKLFAASILTLALLGPLTAAAGLDGETCNEGEKQCIPNGQMIGQCANGMWAIVKICEPGDLCVENPTPLCASSPDGNATPDADSDVSTIEGLGNDGAEGSTIEGCRDGDAQCEVLPLILLGRHAIKRCNTNNKWFTDTVCIQGDVCHAKPYPHCASVEAIEAREEDNDGEGENDFIDADQINEDELPCIRCARFRDQCTTDCYKVNHNRKRTWCQKTCNKKMKDYLVEKGNRGRYQGTCAWYCPHL